MPAVLRRTSALAYSTYPQTPHTLMTSAPTSHPSTPPPLPRAPLRPGAKAEEAATGSGASGAADAAARTAGFDVPDVGTESADAPSPATAAAFGPGPDLMGGIDDVVGGSANMDGRRVAEGAQEMYREAKSGDRAGEWMGHCAHACEKARVCMGPCVCF